jgi:hypothetical protein
MLGGAGFSENDDLLPPQHFSIFVLAGSQVRERGTASHTTLFQFFSARCAITIG